MERGCGVVMSYQSNFRDTALVPRFFFFDARCLFPLLLFFFHMSWATFVVAGCGVAFFALLERRGITPKVFFYLCRSTLAGPVRTVGHSVRLRRRVRW